MFLDGAAGALFAIYFPPAPGKYRGHDVLVLPAFAEEMNKARRMVAVQAGELGRRGIGTLVVDLYGTGDSAGDFRDARWEIWESDVGTALAWLDGNGSTRTGVLAVRFGALLAKVVLERAERLSRLVLWQPVIRGNVMLTQFLRLRTAAAMSLSAGEGESVTALRDALARGEIIEVAGYELSPALARAMDSARLDDLPTSKLPPTASFELTASESQSPAPASRRVLDKWRHAGVAVDAETIPTHPFWTGLNITVVPELITRTTQCFQAYHWHERDTRQLRM